MTQTGHCNTEELILQRPFVHISSRNFPYAFITQSQRSLSPKNLAEWMCPLAAMNFSFGCYCDIYNCIYIRFPRPLRNATNLHKSKKTRLLRRAARFPSRQGETTRTFTKLLRSTILTARVTFWLALSERFNRAANTRC